MKVLLVIRTRKIKIYNRRELPLSYFSMILRYITESSSEGVYLFIRMALVW